MDRIQIALAFGALALVVGLLFIIFVGFAYRPKPASDVKLTARRYRLYWFEPKPDITAYELALLHANIAEQLSGYASPWSAGFWIPNEYPDAETAFKALYGVDGMGRHFTPSTSIEEGPEL